MLNNLKMFWIVLKLFFKGFSSESIKMIIDKYTLKNQILSFRTQSLAFGHDLSNYTDDEIIQMTNDAGKEIAKCGVSAKEFTEAFSRLQESFIKNQL